LWEDSVRLPAVVVLVRLWEAGLVVVRLWEGLVVRLPAVVVLVRLWEAGFRRPVASVRSWREGFQLLVVLVRLLEGPVRPWMKPVRLKAALLVLKAHCFPAPLRQPALPRCFRARLFPALER
jgi:hypothetical protein